MVIAIAPFLALKVFDIQGFIFGGTSILITVGVMLETMKQIDSQLMMRNYEGFLSAERPCEHERAKPRLVLLGKQGAGKGTQATRVAEHYGVAHLSTGDMFREQAALGTAFGLEAKRYMDAGELVPDEIVVGVVEECLAPGGPLDDGFVLDGFPRTLHQAQELDRVLGGASARRRDQHRRAARDRARPARRPAGVRELPARVPREHAADDGLDVRHLRRAASCSATTTPRKRSTAGSSSTSSETVPIIDYYRDQGLLDVVDGVGEGDEVFDRLVKVDGAKRPASPERPSVSVVLRKTPPRSRTCARPGGSWPRCTRSASGPRSRARRPPISTARPATCSTAGTPRSNFLGYHGFPAVACISPNEVIVHGIPGDRAARRRRHRLDRLRGDHRGLARRRRDHRAGRRDRRRVAAADRRHPGVARGRDRRRSGPATASPTSARRAKAVVTAAGFSVVREYVGHGIGTAMHEEPDVPNYGPPGRGLQLRTGVVLAIEPMVNAGGAATRLLDDGWTVVTADGSRSAHFEHTVALTDDGPEILTRAG